MILEEIFNLMMINSFYFKESLGHSMEDRQIVSQHLHSIVIGFIQVLMHFFINDGRYRFAVVSFRPQLLAKEDLFLVLAENHRSEAVAHAPFHNHLAEDAGHLLEVTGSAAGNFIENDLFCAPAAQCHTDLSQKMGFGNKDLSS